MTHLLVKHGEVRVMGIVNVTPDSFSDGGRYLDTKAAIAHAHALACSGADILDIGGESTRPGARPVDAATELARIEQVIRAVAGEGLSVSVDTMHASTARAAVEAGARMVNDVSGGLGDLAMLETLADLDCQIVLGHMRGTPQTMQTYARYNDPVGEVVNELTRRVEAAMAAGIGAERIVLDPGIGFAKEPEHSWAVLRGLPEIAAVGHPVMIGVSRKRLLEELVPAGAPVSQRDLPTAVISALLARRGVAAVRVHDVAATRTAIAAMTRLRKRAG